MTPKEKAKELYNNFFNLLKGTNYPYEYAKINALILVDEILSLPGVSEGRMIVVIPEDYQYWKDVKKEITEL